MSLSAARVALAGLFHVFTRIGWLRLLWITATMGPGLRASYPTPHRSFDYLSPDIGDGIREFFGNSSTAFRHWNINKPTYWCLNGPRRRQSGRSFSKLRLPLHVVSRRRHFSHQ
jgi:hypothetical protein